MFSYIFCTQNSRHGLSGFCAHSSCTVFRLLTVSWIIVNPQILLSAFVPYVYGTHSSFRMRRQKFLTLFCAVKTVLKELTSRLTLCLLKLLKAYIMSAGRLHYYYISYLNHVSYNPYLCHILISKVNLNTLSILKSKESFNQLGILPTIKQ